MARRTKRTTTTVSVTPATTTRTEFNPDYSDVKKDLKRIAMLAGFFISVLIILSFVIN